MIRDFENLALVVGAPGTADHFPREMQIAVDEVQGESGPCVDLAAEKDACLEYEGCVRVKGRSSIACGRWIDTPSRLRRRRGGLR